MAAVTPVSAGTAGFIDSTRGLPEAPSSPAATDVILTNYTLSSNRSRYKTRLYYFSSIADGDTWTHGLNGVKFVMAQASDVDDTTPDSINAYVSSATVITFTAGATGAGYVMVWVDPVGNEGLRGL